MDEKECRDLVKDWIDQKINRREIIGVLRKQNCDEEIIKKIFVEFKLKYKVDITEEYITVNSPFLNFIIKYWLGLIFCIFLLLLGIIFIVDYHLGIVLLILSGEVLAVLGPKIAIIAIAIKTYVSLFVVRDSMGGNFWFKAIVLASIFSIIGDLLFPSLLFFNLSFLLYATIFYLLFSWLYGLKWFPSVGLWLIIFTLHFVYNLFLAYILTVFFPTFTATL